MYGENNNVEITPQILMQHDVIITIGKTVQYALALGIPIYNYDIHGGGGYINLQNFEEAEFYNFSGRDNPRKLNSNEIAREILDHYKEICLQCGKLRNIAIEKFILPNNINKVLAKIEITTQKEYDFSKYDLYLKQVEYLTNEILRCHKKISLITSEDNLKLFANKKHICYSYYRYKILSKVLFGKKRKHYKEKAAIYHEKVLRIKDYMSTLQT